MRKGFGIFWLLFFLYFIFAHPAIIYYNTSFESTSLAHVNPNTALFNLGLSFLLWVTVFSISFWLILKYNILANKNIKRLSHTGKRLPAEIVSVKPLKSPNGKFEAKTITLQLENLAGETIWHSISFTDTKPEQNRYQVGKKCYLRIDPSFKTTPSVILEESSASISWFFLITWIILLAAALSYFLFSYQLEHAGYGWRFLSMEHPLIIVPACILFFPGILFLLLKYVFFKKMNIGSAATRLKFRGKKAAATVLHVEQTGTSINDQPEVRFHVQFEATDGKSHTATLTKIVSLIDLGTVKSVKKKNVFYDPENLKRIAFEEDIIDKTDIS